MNDSDSQSLEMVRTDSQQREIGSIDIKNLLGSGDWIRTSDLVVNSHPLYR